MGTLLALELHGDSAAACFVDGVLRCAVRECLLTRRPPGSGFPSAAIDAVLDAAAVSARDVSRVVVTGVAPSDRISRVHKGIRAFFSKRGAAGGGVRVRYSAIDAGPVEHAALVAALAAAGLGGARLDVVLRTAAAGVLEAAFVADSSLSRLSAPVFGLDFNDMAAYRALSNAKLPRARVSDPRGAASEALAVGETVVWARGPAAFLELPVGPRMILRSGGQGTLCTAGQPDYFGPELAARATPLTAPDGLPALSAVDVVRAWRALPGARLILGDYWV